jgi:hypothetical protein
LSTIFEVYILSEMAAAMGRKRKPAELQKVGVPKDFVDDVG